MPLYEYQCDQCGVRFERIRKFSDPPLGEPCPTCGGAIRKLISSPAIQFKGAGWYVNDYAKPGASGEKKSGADSSEAQPDAKSDASKNGKTQGTSDAKAESKAGAKADATSDTSSKPAASTSSSPAPKADKT
jgi:putative FmdB family regulatory protein